VHADLVIGSIRIRLRWLRNFLILSADFCVDQDHARVYLNICAVRDANYTTGLGL